MKTIKQIADELGVSKTAVRKKIENLGLRSSLQKNGNQFAIDENQEKLIKSAFVESETETKTETNSQTKTETVSVLVSMLQLELQAKNEQIAALTAELALERQHSREQSERLAVLADQAQKLQLVQLKADDDQQAAVSSSSDEPNSGKEKKWWQVWK